VTAAFRQRSAKPKHTIEGEGGLPKQYVLAFALLALFASPAAVAQSPEDYPSRPVRIVTITPPGGTADVLARILAAHLQETFGVSFVVENRPGASGATASTVVAKSAPDGYTLLFTAVNSLAILPNLVKDLQYDPVKDFAPISLVSYAPNLLLANPSLPAKTISELIDLLRHNPGKYDYGSGGIGSSQHLSMAIFLNATGTTMNHVPFSGGSGQLTTALLANTVSVGFDVMTTSMAHVQSGTLRALGVSSRERSPSAPEIPAVAEFVPGFEVVSWNAVVAPAGTPAAIVDKLSKAIGGILRSPAVGDRLREIGTTPVGSPPGELADVIVRDTKKFGAALAAAGIQPQ
jgi:tripartite-type tricarboxylate transporter receptor subunit TctC